MSNEKSKPIIPAPSALSDDAGWHKDHHFAAPPAGIDHQTWDQIQWHQALKIPFPSGEVDHKAWDWGYYTALAERGVESGAPGPKPTWERFATAGNYDLSLGSAVYQLFTKGFTGWFAGDPFAVIAAFFNFGRVLTKTTLNNLTKGAFKGKKSTLVGLGLVGLTVLAVWLVVKKWWEPNHPPAKTPQTTLAVLDRGIQKTSDGLAALGVDSQLITEQATLARFDEGAKIAARSRAQDIQIVTPVALSPTNAAGTDPTHYRPIAEVSSEAYFTGLSKAHPTRADLLKNAAAIHRPAEIGAER